MVIPFQEYFCRRPDNPASDTCDPPPKPAPNPNLPFKPCGLDIAMAVDISSSIMAHKELVIQMKQALIGFADVLETTPTRLSLTYFSGSAETFVAMTDNFDLIRQQLNSMESISIPDGTNWEDGFIKSRQTFTTDNRVKLTLFTTDGLPSVDNNNSVYPEEALISAINEANKTKFLVSFLMIVISGEIGVAYAIIESKHTNKRAIPINIIIFLLCICHAPLLFIARIYCPDCSIVFAN